MATPSHATESVYALIFTCVLSLLCKIDSHNKWLGIAYPASDITVPPLPSHIQIDIFLFTGYCPNCTAIYRYWLTPICQLRLWWRNNIFFPSDMEQPICWYFAERSTLQNEDKSKPLSSFNIKSDIKITHMTNWQNSLSANMCTLIINIP